MKLALALAVTLAMVSLARADSFTDAGKTGAAPIVDVSRTSNPTTNCNITVTTTATSLSSLWTTAGCLTALPANAQFAFVTPRAAPVWICSDGNTPVAADTAGACATQIAALQSWPVEGRLSIANLKLIANGASAVVNVEVRY